VNSPAYNIVEGPYLADILDQPGAVQATMDALFGDQHLVEQIARIRKKKYKRIVLTGMGASFHALYPLQLALAAQGETPCWVETAELNHSLSSLLSPESLIIAVSQSGKSVEMVRLLDENGGRAPLIGVTNTQDSPLYRKADFCMLTAAGDESTVSTKTYLASLIGLEVLAAAWAGDLDGLRAEMADAADLISSYLASWADHVQAIASLLDGVGQYFILGRGRSLASCGSGALVVKESTRSFAEGMSSAAFRHGPLEMVSCESLVLVFDGDPRVRSLNRKLVRDIEQHGGRAESIGPGSDIPALRLPDHLQCKLNLLEILPVQILTLAIAARAGVEAGRFEHARKVTTEE
jgi:glucosamine--fructose-6-phosphate aminotransferase (isomerizing)